ncbi:hypothetical protein EON65_07200 [archaeon]|nr:MAG: hypothetical protein EON65_07200 [archaeon]
MDKFIPWCIDWMVASLSKAFTMQMSKAIPAVAPLSDFEIANMPATSKARDEGLPPQKLRRKYQRACTKATDNASLFANIVVLSYEDDTEDTTEMPETVKLASFLTRKLSGSHDEVEGKEEGEKQVSLASMPTRVGPTDITSESGNGQLDSHAHGGKIGDVCINTVHDLPSKDAVPLSQRSSIVSESSSDSYSDSDASIVSTDKPDSLFGMVQKAIWRVM